MRTNAIVGVYVFTNTVTGEFYLGSSVRVQDRYTEHRTALRRGRHYNPGLQASWNQYGPEAFEGQLICRCDRSKLKVLEQALLDRLVGDPLCLNIAIDAISCMKGRHHTPELRARMRFPAGALAASILVNKTRIRTAEEREKRSRSSTGRKQSEETRRKRFKAWTGKKHTPESRARMKAGRRRYWEGLSPEQRAEVTANRLAGIQRAVIARQVARQHT